MHRFILWEIKCPSSDPAVDFQSFFQYFIQPLDYDASFIACCPQSALKLGLHLWVGIVQNPTQTSEKTFFLFSPLQISFAFKNPLVSNCSVLCSVPYNGVHTAFWVNTDPGITAEEGNYLTHFCVLPCLGRGRWMCQTWQWWLWAALRKYSGQLPVRLWSWLWTGSWQKELWRYSVLLFYELLNLTECHCWMECYTFHMLCPSSVRSVGPNLENQCSLLSSGAKVMSVHSSHVSWMLITNLACQALLLVYQEWCKVGLCTFLNHLFSLFILTKAKSPTVPKETTISRAMRHCLWI